MRRMETAMPTSRPVWWGPSETIPLIEGKLGLSRWQNIFFCEFDGHRSSRTVVVTVLADH